MASPDLPCGQEWLVLVAAARGGGPEDFAALAWPLAYWIGRYGRARAAAIQGAGVTVEDVVQDVLVDVWLALPTTPWRSEGHLLAWVRTVTCRRVADLSRRGPGMQVRPVGLGGELEPWLPPQDYGRPDRLVEDSTPRLCRAVAALAARRREALVAHLNGDSDRDIAARLGASISAVRVARHRALRTLRAHLSHSTGHPRPAGQGPRT